MIVYVFTMWECLYYKWSCSAHMDMFCVYCGTLLPLCLSHLCTTWLPLVSYYTYQLVVAWILKLAKATAQTMDNQRSVSDVAKLQAIGLAAIAITEAVSKNADSKLTVNELEEVAKLLSYHGLPLHQMLECQVVVATIFSKLKSRWVQICNNVCVILLLLILWPNIYCSQRHPVYFEQIYSSAF